MKSQGKIACLLMVSMLAGSNIIGRADTAAVKKELEAQYAKIGTAIRARNVKAVMALDTPDYTMQVDANTTLTRADIEKAYQKQVTNTQEVKEMSFTIEDIKLVGGQAIVNVQTKEVILLSSVQQVLSGSIQPTRHTLVAQQIALDTWVKTANGWRLKFEQVTKKVATLDGKPLIQAPAPAPKDSHPKPDGSQQTDSAPKSDGSQKSGNPPK